MMIRASIDGHEFTLCKAAAALADQSTPEWIAEAIREKLEPFCAKMVAAVERERGKDAAP